jgi:MYXO-CTERM domain-containing protein
VSVNGFFFATPGYSYSCDFGSQAGFVSAITVSSTLIACPLPNTVSRVTSIGVYQRTSNGIGYIGAVKATFDFSASCTNTGGGGDDKWPYWAWILVGLGAVGALTTLMGLAALVYVTWCRSEGEGDYEQLIYADNPIHFNSEQQLALDRKTFSV